jgi:integrase
MPMRILGGDNHLVPRPFCLTPSRIPRYIPAEELERLMAAVATLECPYQRAALLIARWTGARKGEIERLAVDCLYLLSFRTHVPCS